MGYTVVIMSSKDDNVIDIRSRPRSQRAPAAQPAPVAESKPAARPVTEYPPAQLETAWHYPDPVEKPLMGEALQDWMRAQRARNRIIARS